jgi:RNA recognition motif-containing protein
MTSLAAPKARPQPRPTNRGHRSAVAVPSPADRRPQLRPRPRSTPIEPSTNVFVNYIPADFTEADLCALCAPYGTILCSKIMINLETGESKCFGFVRFSSLPEAHAAIQDLNGRPIGGKRLLAKYAESREKKERVSTMLYVKRLPVAVSQARVAELFAAYGEILDLTPHVLDAAEPQFWRCVIRYSNCAAAAAAIAGMNNQIIAGDTRPIHVRYADQSRMSASFVEHAMHAPSVLDGADVVQLLPSFLLA